MLVKAPNQDQREWFKATLQQIIHLQHPFVILVAAIPWHRLEKKIAPLYAHTGAPSHRLRKRVGKLLLRCIAHLSDERVVAQWRESPYFLYLCGAASFQGRKLCTARDLVHFMNQLGQQAIQDLFALSIHMHGKRRSKAKEILVDTIVQEQNSARPTGAKRYKKVIARCSTFVQRVGIKLLQSYRCIAHKLFYRQRDAYLPTHLKKASKALKQRSTLACRQIRDLPRKLEGVGLFFLYAKPLW